MKLKTEIKDIEFRVFIQKEGKKKKRSGVNLG